MSKKTTKTEEFEVSTSTAEQVITSVSWGRVKTVEDALRRAEIDLVNGPWELGESTVSSQEVATKHPETGVVTVTPLWHVRVKLGRRTGGVDFEGVAAKAVEAMASHAPLYDVSKFAPSPAIPFGRALELDIFDAHIGKLSWKPETGSDYDTLIASCDYMKAMEKLLALTKPFPVDAVILPTGNDFMHVDTERGTTTKGTQVDVDTRATKVFQVSCQLLVRAIERLLHVAPRVLVPIIPGNHDSMSMYHLGMYLAAWFRQHPDKVLVDCTPPTRKYVRWGSILLGYDHGSECPPGRLPMVMAHERPVDWAETTTRVWRVGHLHSAKREMVQLGEELEGVTITRCTALCPADAWHAKKGFVGVPRGASAAVLDKDSGVVAEFRIRL